MKSAASVNAPAFDRDGVEAIASASAASTVLPTASRTRTIWLLDVETTGLRERKHRIVEVALLLYSPSRPFAQSWLVNPGCSVPLDAKAIHGIGDDMLRDAPCFKDVWPLVTAVIEGAKGSEVVSVESPIVVAHFAKFDRGFIEAEMERAGFDLPDWDWACSIDVAKATWPFRVGGYGLGALMKSLGITHFGHHRARADVEALGTVLDAAGLSLMGIERNGQPQALIHGEVSALSLLTTQLEESARILRGNSRAAAQVSADLADVIAAEWAAEEADLISAAVAEAEKNATIAAQWDAEQAEILSTTLALAEEEAAIAVQGNAEQAQLVTVAVVEVDEEAAIASQFDFEFAEAAAAVEAVAKEKATISAQWEAELGEAVASAEAAGRERAAIPAQYEVELAEPAAVAEAVAREKAVISVQCEDKLAKAVAAAGPATAAEAAVVPEAAVVAEAAKAAEAASSERFAISPRWEAELSKAAAAIEAAAEEEAQWDAELAKAAAAVEAAALQYSSLTIERAAEAAQVAASPLVDRAKDTADGSVAPAPDEASGGSNEVVVKLTAGTAGAGEPQCHWSLGHLQQRPSKCARFDSES